MALGPRKSENNAFEEEGISFYFEDLTAEQAKSTPVYTFVAELEMACKQRLAEIKQDLADKKRLVASSILQKLAGLHAVGWEDDDGDA